MSRGRWPLAENDAEARHARLPAPSMFAPGMPRTTPGTVRVRLTKLRPLSGSCRICSSLTVVPSSDEDVCTSGEAPVTVMVSETASDFEFDAKAEALVDAEPDAPRPRPT